MLGTGSKTKAAVRQRLAPSGLPVVYEGDEPIGYVVEDVLGHVWVDGQCMDGEYGYGDIGERYFTWKWLGE
jgi:hypothetical protein